jgi:18S rRNA (adenine1779-N6/adenine1780-N6)-dimethyltransferase
MVAQLEERFPNEIASKRLEIIRADFAKLDLHDTMAPVTPFDMCVANIPYNISSPCVSQLLSYGSKNNERFRGSVLMVQEEFALRLMATYVAHTFMNVLNPTLIDH